MGKVRDFHERAMDLADIAFDHAKRGETSEARECFLGAMGLEILAADMVAAITERDNELSRSILYRSAASLAVAAGENKAAKHLANEGLKGKPPSDIEYELREILESIQGDAS